MMILPGWKTIHYAMLNQDEGEKSGIGWNKGNKGNKRGWVYMANRKAIVMTLSDGAHYGTRSDESGQILAGLLQENGFDVVECVVLPDVRVMIVQTLDGYCAATGIHLIATTGGTGLGPRDVTPEATRDVIDKEIPGMAEAMRLATLTKTPFAMTSRQVVGVRRQTLIVNFPGSPKAVTECFDVVKPVLHHVIDLISGNTSHDKKPSP